MSLFDGIKGFFKGVGETFDKVIDGVGDAAGWVADKVGDGVEGITRAVAGEDAAKKVKDTFDKNIEPAVQRGIEGVVRFATPIGLGAAVDDIAQKGLIDGIVGNVAEGVQDVIGGTTRLLAGEHAEAKFDKVYDERVQPILETVAGTVGRAALAVVPGGQIALASDFASEAASLGLRAASGEKLGTMDYLGVVASVPFVAGSATLKGFQAAGQTTKSLTQSAVNSVDDVAGVVTKTVANSADDVVGVISKNADDVVANIVPKTLGETVREETVATLKDEVVATAQDEVLGQILSMPTQFYEEKNPNTSQNRVPSLLNDVQLGSVRTLNPNNV